MSLSYVVVAGRYEQGVRKIECFRPAENFEEAFAQLTAAANGHQFAHIEIYHGGQVYTFAKDSGASCPTQPHDPLLLNDRRNCARGDRRKGPANDRRKDRDRRLAATVNQFY